jgi:hypothetical protein
MLVWEQPRRHGELRQVLPQVLLPQVLLPQVLLPQVLLPQVLLRQVLPQVDTPVGVGEKAP